MFADAGYRGREGDAAVEGYELRVVTRAEIAERKKLKAKEFAPYPKRWVIEQTFGCLSAYRGLKVCNERLAAHAEAFFMFGSIHRMTKRLIS